MRAMRLFALRGATDVAVDERKAILDATATLLREVLQRNALRPDDVVSAVFTVTGDLTAEFPAVAARQNGFSAVPLLCAREMEVPGAMPRVVRVLMHYHATDDHRPQHVYLGEARRLRLDLEGAQ